MYFGAVRLDFAKFFKYTGIFLIIVAAGILGYGIHALQSRRAARAARRAFDISDGYDASSWNGQTVLGIFNFRPTPTVLQAVAWVVYIVVVVLFLFLRPYPHRPLKPPDTPRPRPVPTFDPETTTAYEKATPCPTTLPLATTALASAALLAAAHAERAAPRSEPASTDDVITVTAKIKVDATDTV